VIVHGRTRKFREALIWVADMIVYGLLAISGWAVLTGPSAYVIKEVKYPAIITIWGCLLFFGGLVALIGRVSRFWVVELPGNVAASGGALLYSFIILSAVSTGSSLLLFMFVTIGWVTVVRRYIELRIFTSEPGDKFSERLAELITRRTTNTVPRIYY
jgi:hypothetical protein